MNDLTPPKGYYLHPTLHGDRVVFSSEGDLWSVPADGGVAGRLTRGLGVATDARFSPDGQRLAFTAREEGAAEVYTMPAGGGPLTRLSWHALSARVIGWRPDGGAVRYVSYAGQPFARAVMLREVDAAGGEPRALPLGPVQALAEGPGGLRALAWHQDDIARWKRYRGGRAGVIWVGIDGQWRKLAVPGGNCVRPMWVGARLVFLSDHEGRGALYSCEPDGGDLRRETGPGDFCPRFPTTDGQRVVYSAGADLWIWTPGEGERRLEVGLASPRPGRQPRFVRATRWLESPRLHPEGHSIGLICRGRPSVTGLWEGPVLQPGEPAGARYRLLRFLPDGGLVCVADRPGEEEAVEILPASGPPRRLSGLDIGRALTMEVSPKGDRLALTNHRQELLVLGLSETESPELRRLDYSPEGRLGEPAWSPDGRWLTWSRPEGATTSSIALAEVATGAVTAVTRPEFWDFRPCFDPKGRYLFFLSNREFNPVFDQQVFDYGFPRSGRLCLVTLQAALPDPFLARPRPLEPPKDVRKEKEIKVTIDLEGLPGRVVRFPIGAGSYGNIGAAGDRVFYTSLPTRGRKGVSWSSEDTSALSTLRVFDLQKLEDTALLTHISDFRVGPDGKTVLVRAGRKLRVIQASLKVEKEKSKRPGRKTGWLDLHRVSSEVSPPDEWAQMLREAWRLMRDHFWTEDMSGVDWGEVWERYSPLLARVGDRLEFSELVWEMYGELGTSHAYEIGGDYERPPDWRPGLLGADLEGDPETGGARITRVLTADAWDTAVGSPLARPGIDAAAGDVVVAIDGQRVSPERPLQALLRNRSGREIALTLRRGEAEHTVSLRTLRGETALRYRDWVEARRSRVHEATDGAVGYIHIPDMGPEGFAEFYRASHTELSRPGLILDARYNRGGHVSSLLLQVLSRRRLGYSISRWMAPRSYPRGAPQGPMVCLTNEYAGSDGDMFSHCFKLMGLGPLVGERTWGGVVGIWPRHRLVDGSVTSQPEFANWFMDVRYGLEGYGTDPDVEVAMTPEDWAAGRDPQLERGLELVRELLAAAAPAPPDFGPRPDRSR